MTIQFAIAVCSPSARKVAVPRHSVAPAGYIHVYPTGRKSSLSRAPSAFMLFTKALSSSASKFATAYHWEAAHRTMTELGSDSWVGLEQVDEENELYDRTTAFIGAIKWQALTALATRMRSVDCQLSEKYSVGHFNLVRRLQFADGVSWIARLRLPELPSMFGQREALNAKECMRIEIATMKYLRYVTIAGAHPHDRAREMLTWLSG